MKSRAIAIIFLLVFLTLLCDTAGRADAGEDAVQQRIQQHLRPWDKYDNEWAAESSIVVLANYRQGAYPCIFHEDGSSSMMLRSTFTIEQAIEGEIGRGDFDANLSLLDGKRFPRDFVSGRKYLVFLKPSEESSRILRDKKASFNLLTQISPEELVAMIDISKSKAEVDSERIMAHKTGKHGEFEFSPEKWRHLRESKDIGLAAQKAFVPFIMAVVLPDGATIAHVRSYLGEPDYRYMNEDGTYYEYRLNTASSTPHGTVSGRVELHFRPDTQLKGYYIKFHKYIHYCPVKSQIVATGYDKWCFAFGANLS